VGQTQPQAVFEIMGRAGELSAQQFLLRSHYSEGLTAYRARRWDEADNAFNLIWLLKRFQAMDHLWRC